MNRRDLALSLMILAIMTVGCGGAASGLALQDTQWVLVALGEQPLLAGTAPSAEFSASEMRGSAGCNTYLSTYAVRGGEFRIGDIASTEMWCMEPTGLMDQEQAFLATLASIGGYRIAEGKLELLDAAGAVILAFESR